MIRIPILALLTILLANVEPAFAKEKLVPAQFSSRTDKTGFVFTPDAHGRVNSSLGWIYSGLSSSRGGLNIQQRLMKPDRSEYVYKGRLGQLSFSRRLRISKKHRGIRVVESFTNQSGRPIQTTFILHAQASRRSPQVLTDRGRPANGALAKNEGGVICQVQHPSQMLLCYQLASPTAPPAFKPNVFNQNNHNIQFQYNLVVPSNGTLSIVHGAQIDQGQAVPPTSRLKALFREMRSTRWLRDLPAEIRTTIANTRIGPGFGEPGSLPSVESLMELAPASTDRLAFSDETLLQGKARCDKLTIKGAHGQSILPFDRVAAITGKRSRGGQSAVYLRDGQRLTGTIDAEGFRFELSSGMSIDLELEKLDRLVLRRSRKAGAEEDGTSTAESGSPLLAVDATPYLLLETYGGDRLRASRSAQILEATTQWGSVQIPFTELDRVHPAETEDPGHWIWLSDGSRFRAYLRGRQQTLETELFGRISIAPQEIQRILNVRRERGSAKDTPELTRPFLVVAGGDRLVGRVDLDALHFLTAGGVVPQPPTQLKHVQLQGEYESIDPGVTLRFRAEVWGGGHLTGELREVILPFHTAHGALRIPVRDIQEIHVPTPVVPAAMRPRMHQWIEDLGSESWAKREAATSALAELGELARGPLEEGLRAATDPEVERRLRRLLDRL